MTCVFIGNKKLRGFGITSQAILKLRRTDTHSGFEKGDSDDADNDVKMETAGWAVGGSASECYRE